MPENIHNSKFLSCEYKRLKFAATSVHTSFYASRGSFCAYPTELFRYQLVHGSSGPVMTGLFLRHQQLHYIILKKYLPDHQIDPIMRLNKLRSNIP